MCPQGQVINRTKDAGTGHTQLVDPSVGQSVSQGDVLDSKVTSVDQEAVGVVDRLGNACTRNVGNVTGLLPTAHHVLVPGRVQVPQVHIALVQAVKYLTTQ